MPSLVIVLDSIEGDFAQAPVFYHSDFLGSRVEHNIVLILDIVPLVTQAQRLHRAHKAVLFFSARICDDLVMQRNHMLFRPSHR